MKPGEPCVVTGLFWDVKSVKTRNAHQLIIEIPSEIVDQAVRMLGGTPQTGKEKPVAVVLLNTEAALVKLQADFRSAPEPAAVEPSLEARPDIVENLKEVVRPLKDERAVPLKTKPEKAVQRCAILCGEPEFQVFIAAKALSEFIHVGDPNQLGTPNTAERLRRLLGIGSRAQIATDPAALARWNSLVTDFDTVTGRLPERRGA